MGVIIQQVITTIVSIKSCRPETLGYNNQRLNLQSSSKIKERDIPVIWISGKELRIQLLL